MAIRNKEDAQRVLKHVPEEKRFYCHDGRIISNIFELKGALESMSEPSYNHHVTAEKNDFARWVREVLVDDKLSTEIAKALGPQDAARVVASRIKWLQAKLK